MTKEEPESHAATTRALLAALCLGGGSGAAHAREALVSRAEDRMRALARRMLAGSPRVRRWNETDDVVQGALLRLHRALCAVIPNDAQHFLRLAALQVRRELIDLTRRVGNPDSFAARHDTDVCGDSCERIEDVASEPDGPDRMAEWTRFHETVESLCESDRDLFGMVWYLGMSQDEIADFLGCSPRTVRRRWDETKRSFVAAFQADPPE